MSKKRTAVKPRPIEQNDAAFDASEVLKRLKPAIELLREREKDQMAARQHELRNAVPITRMEIELVEDELNKFKGTADHDEWCSRRKSAIQARWKGARLLVDTQRDLNNPTMGPPRASSMPSPLSMSTKSGSQTDRTHNRHQTFLSLAAWLGLRPVQLNELDIRRFRMVASPRDVGTTSCGNVSWDGALSARLPRKHGMLDDALHMQHQICKLRMETTVLGTQV